MMRWRREKRREDKGAMGCKLTVNFNTRTKELYERDK